MYTGIEREVERSTVHAMSSLWLWIKKRFVHLSMWGRCGKLGETEPSIGGWGDGVLWVSRQILWWKDKAAARGSRPWVLFDVVYGLARYIKFGIPSSSLIWRRMWWNDFTCTSSREKVESSWSCCGLRIEAQWCAFQVAWDGRCVFCRELKGTQLGDLI